MKNGETKMVPLSDIEISIHNVRKIDLQDEDFKSLVQSIKGTDGVIQAVIVRPLTGPLTDKYKKYELLAGKRRFYATAEAGMVEIKAEIRELDDATALLFMTAENLQRKDLKPFEMANIMKTLLTESSDLQAAASNLGVSVNWLARRAKLCDLSENWMKVMEAELFKLWSIAHFELIARFDEGLQLEILDDLKAKKFIIKTWSIKQLNEFLGEKMKLLKNTIWKLDDDTVYPTAAACTTCNKRTGCQPELFHDNLTPKSISDTDRCLDVGCFDTKFSMFVDREIGKYKNKHEDLVFVSGDYGKYEGSNGPVLLEHDVEPAKKSDSQAVPAVIVSGNKAGKFKYVKIKTHAKEKAGARPKEKDTNKPKSPSYDEKMLRLNRRWYAHAINQIAEMIDKSNEEAWAAIKFDTKLTTGEDYLVYPVVFDMEGSSNAVALSQSVSIIALACAFGTDSKNTYFESRKPQTEWDEYHILSTGSTNITMLKLWLKIAPVLKSRLRVYDNAGAEAMIPEAQNICNFLGLNWEDLIKNAVEAIPIPPSLLQKKKTAKDKTTKKKAAKKTAKKKAVKKTVKRKSLLK